MTDLETDLTKCTLCEHKCKVNRLAGEAGVCRIGIPIVASRTLHRAPPESYTIFTAGCNFKCLNCQNWSISQFPDNRMAVDGYVDAETLARECIHKLDSYTARMMGADRIFFSGGEPTIHLPFIERVVAEARKLKPACKVNFDTNGFMTQESLERVLAFTTSITFDIKAFYDETHRAITGAPVEPVLRNARIVAEEAKDRLWEFRITVIPQVNEEDIGPLCHFLAEISPDPSVCFLAFRPNYIMEEHPGATMELMQRCVDFAKEAGLRNVTWSGVTDLPGTTCSLRPEVEKTYERSGARMAASYALTSGCPTHLRDCGACPCNNRCPVKAYIPKACY